MEKVRTFVFNDGPQRDHREARLVRHGDTITVTLSRYKGMTSDSPKVEEVTFSFSTVEMFHVLNAADNLMEV